MYFILLFFTLIYYSLTRTDELAPYSDKTDMFAVSLYLKLSVYAVSQLVISLVQFIWQLLSFYI